MKRPMARPVSTGLPMMSPRQNGIRPGVPGETGVTTTRSCPIVSMRQAVEPRRKVSPGRLSWTISSSSSPTLEPSGRVTW